MAKNLRIILPYWRATTIAFTIWLLLAWIMDVMMYGFISVLWPVEALGWVWLVNMVLFCYCLRYERNHSSRR